MKIRSVLLLVLVLGSLASMPAMAQAVDPFIGEIQYVAFNFAPKGWELCNGQLLPISQNTALFALIGTYYGGDGISTFALPDMQGRVPVAAGTGAGLTPRQNGDKGGLETVTLTVDQLPKHRHSLHGSSASADSTAPAGSVIANSSKAIYNTQTPDATLKTGSVGFTGGGQSHENMQPFLGLTCIIAMQGIFPSRP